MASHPGVYPTWPTVFRPFPEPIPRTLPPPVKERSFRSPFGINKDLYNFALRPEIPFTFAALYVVSVFALNAYNRRRKQEPWPVSKQEWFKYFVVVHNVVLALYSFATFLAMFRAITHTLPAWNAENWGPRTADALCKLHGPRGLGDAATFNTTINIWEVKNAAIHMGYDGNPDPTDVGRLWNEGLAFWGWLFYVSKFYEVLDTLIILAKGKRSATLQTYHHAGAMLCMWAGIRYMSPPIWMFVFINSIIHALMYTYFAASALGYRVPQSLKRALTSLQIAQFVFGASYAAAHLFIKYDIPMEVPYHFTNIIEHAASSASSAATAATKSATSVASGISSFAESPTIAPSMGAFIKKLLLRAAGEEGVAERVGMEQKVRDAVRDPLGLAGNQLPGVEQKVEKWIEKRFETRYHTEWTKTNCIDTSGEAFAIYLNLLYLAPLTFLFARFFVRAYTQRGQRRSISQAAHRASEAAKDASNQAEYEVERSGRKAEDELAERGPKVKEEASARLDELRKDVKAMQEGTFRERRVSDRVQSYEQKVKTAAETAADKAKETANAAVEKAKGYAGSGTGSPRKASPSKKAPAENESAIEDEPASASAGDATKSKKEAGSQARGASDASKGKNGASDASKGKNGASDASKGKNGKPSSAKPKKEQDDKPAKAEAASSGNGKDAESSADQPAETQEVNLADTQAVRPGIGKNGESLATGNEKPRKTSNTKPKVEEQTDGLADDQPQEQEDTDAMGKSGSIIDIVGEKAQEASSGAGGT